MNTEITDPLTLNFGKYKGRLIKDLAITNLSYCKWLLNQPFTPSEIKDYISNNINVNEYILKWGKYKNKSVSHIKLVDEKYIDWLQNNIFVLEKCPSLLEALK